MSEGIYESAIMMKLEDFEAVNVLIVFAIYYKEFNF